MLQSLLTGAPTVANGDFDAPFMGSWYFNHLGAPITRIQYSGEYVMQIGNVNCEAEQGAAAFGRIVGTTAGETYTLTFDYLYTQTTSRVRWGVVYFAATGCDPCPAYFFNNVRFARSVQGNQWYTWSGDFTKSQSLGNRNLTVDVDLYTCGYSGKTLLDDFIVTTK